MRILITGASGLVGQPLQELLKQQKHDVTTTSRHSQGDIQWYPPAKPLDSKHLSGLDTIIHLAGENIARKNWSPKQKEYLLHNRQALASDLLAKIQALPAAARPKRVVIASAIGWYGVNDHQPLMAPKKSPFQEEGFVPDEQVQQTFSHQLCAAIESTLAPLTDLGVSTVFARLGVVLSPKGGALAKLLPPFYFGGGGPIGNGSQPFAWISRTDAVQALAWLAINNEQVGAINLVAPEQVTNKQFAQTLGKIMRRPSMLPFPALAVKLLFGQMGAELLLSGRHISCAKLQSAGFHFQHPTLEQALLAELGCKTKVLQ